MMKSNRRAESPLNKQNPTVGVAPCGRPDHPDKMIANVIRYNRRGRIPHQ